MTRHRRTTATGALAAALFLIALGLVGSAAVSLVLALGSQPAQAATCTAGTNQFTGATSQDWNDGTNWTRTDNATDHHVPCSLEDVLINGTQPVVSAADAVANSIDLESGALTISGGKTLTVGTGPSVFKATVDIGDGTTSGISAGQPGLTRVLTGSRPACTTRCCWTVTAR